MNIALIGQSAFGKAVLEAIVDGGRDYVTGVFAPPAREGRPDDPIVEAAAELDVPVFRFNRLRSDEAVESFRHLDPELCVMAFVTDIVPMDMIEFPSHGTIQYHPSLLPRHRGPSSINWPIIAGETETGITIFWPDDGLDTGPILLQKTVPISPDDTVGSLYFNHLFPLGVEAMIESIDLVREGNPPRIEQDESQATYEGWCRAKDAVVDWSKPAGEVYNLIRGADPQPGANTTWRGSRLSLYDASLSREETDGSPGAVTGISDSGVTVAVNGGSITLARLRPEKGRKVAAAEAAGEIGLEAGGVLGAG